MTDARSSLSPTPNIGWLYYVDYFRERDTINPIDFSFMLNDEWVTPTQVADLLEKRNEEISGLSLAGYDPEHLCLRHLTSDDIFTLTTTYPGLLAGLGYTHGAGLKGEFKLGFSLDYTSGLPIIPGSTVKGILRSAFDKPEWIRGLAGNEELDAAGLKLEIFEGVDVGPGKTPSESYEKKNEWKYLRTAQKDVFHDAIVIGQTEDLLGSDFITPHKHKTHPELDEFADPTPLQFMKVMPGVSFLFQFDVKDGKVAGIGKKGKMELFRQILLSLGVGAKTRVGYGWMESPAT